MGGSLVYVSNLPFDVRERDLDDIFYKYGRIRNINIKKGSKRDLPPFAFVEFSDPRDAADAVYGRDGYDYYGHRLRVEIARGPRPGGGASRAPGTGYRVTVEGLPSSASWQDLKDFMRSAVMPVFADVKKDRDGRPVGVVEFESADDMDRAIRKLDDTEFTSRFEKGCYVRLYEDRGGRGRGRGRGRRERSRSRSRSPAGGKSNKGARERSVSRSVSRSRSPPRERSGSPAPPQPNDAPAAPPAEAPAAAKDDE